MVIGDHFGGGDHFDGGDHFGGGTGIQQRMMNAYSPVQEAVATSWPVPLPL